MKIIIIPVIIAFFIFISAEAKRKKSTDWNKVNLDDVEKDWDSSELQKKYGRMRKMYANRKGPQFEKKEFEVELIQKTLDGKPWMKKNKEALAEKWMEILSSKGLYANITSVKDVNRLHVAVEEGWSNLYVMYTVINQVEIMKLTFEGKNYYVESELPKNEIIETEEF